MADTKCAACQKKFNLDYVAALLVQEAKCDSSVDSGQRNPLCLDCCMLGAKAKAYWEAGTLTSLECRCCFPYPKKMCSKKCGVVFDYDGKTKVLCDNEICGYPFTPPGQPCT